ncbi:MAG TPA: hypothetical protein VMB47_10725 [Candidatus Aquilonibacter sp.]|nr:hypothetical protein [Candidatus Aquilonibacter sp.]
MGAIGKGGGSIALIAMVLAKASIHFFSALLANFSFECFFSAFFSQAESQKAAADGSDRRHEGVIRPQGAMIGREQNHGGIHASRHRDEGIIDDPEQNRAGTSEAMEPIQKLT